LKVTFTFEGKQGLSTPKGHGITNHVKLDRL